MIEAEMYGMMLRAKIDMRLTAPPANMSSRPRIPFDWPWKNSWDLDRIEARQRQVGAEPIDEQSAEREQEPLLELRRLGEGA